MLGYDATNLKFGMPAWAMVEGVSTPPFDAAVDMYDYGVETQANEATETYALPTPLAATIQAAADAYFGAGTKNIKVTDLYDNLNDGDTSNDPFLLDVRSAEDYALGHIPGAVNIGAKVLFAAENLAKLPTDKQIVAYCYTGQTSSQAVSVLNMLGYDATNLKFGMPAWAMVEGVSTPPFKASVDSYGYTFEGTATAGATQAATAAATPEATPAAMPETGGLPFPVEGVLVGFGALTAAAGLYLRRRKAA
jgi:rhodanese-related sulfurtransferase